MRTFGEEIFPRTKSRRKSRVRCQIVLETFLLVVSFAELPERVTFVRQRTAFQNQEISVQRQNLRDLSDQTSFLDALADFLPGDFNDLFALGRVDLDQPESTDLRSVFFPVLFDLKFSVSRRKNFLLERTSLKNRSISLSVKCGCFIVKHFSSSRISAFKWSKSSSSSRKFWKTIKIVRLSTKEISTKFRELFSLQKLCSSFLRRFESRVKSIRAERFVFFRFRRFRRDEPEIFGDFLPNFRRTFSRRSSPPRLPEKFPCFLAEHHQQDRRKSGAFVVFCCSSSFGRSIVSLRFLFASGFLFLSFEFSRPISVEYRFLFSTIRFDFRAISRRRGKSTFLSTKSDFLCEWNSRTGAEEFPSIRSFGRCFSLGKGEESRVDSLSRTDLGLGLVSNVPSGSSENQIRKRHSSREIDAKRTKSKIRASKWKFSLLRISLPRSKQSWRFFVSSSTIADSFRSFAWKFNRCTASRITFALMLNSVWFLASKIDSESIWNSSSRDQRLVD